MNQAAKDHQDVLQNAIAYCEAVWFARTGVFEAMCHERFLMTHIEGGEFIYFDKAAFLARVKARAPADGAASYKVLAIDLVDAMARVHLWVDIPGKRFEDHLGFVKTADGWKLLTKVFRTAAHLDAQGQVN